MRSFAAPADQLPVGDVLPEILLDAAAHNLLEPVEVLLDLEGHCRRSRTP